MPGGPGPWRVQSSQSRGNHVVATSPVATGGSVLEDQAYAAVPYGQNVCHFTLQSAERLFRCGRCKRAWYSSPSAQRNDWKNGHKEECAAQIACAPRVPTPTVRLASRALWRRAREEASGAGAGASYSHVESLMDHWGDLDDERKATYAQMAVVVREYMRGAAAGGAGEAGLHEVAGLLARLACNAHTICDELLQPVGLGLFPTGALVNHSCRPNAMQSFQGSRVRFRAVRPIAAGEEVTISYIELAAPRPQRRATLLAHYFFDIDVQPHICSQGAEGARQAGEAPLLRCQLERDLELHMLARPPPHQSMADVALTEVACAGADKQLSGLYIDEPELRTPRPAEAADGNFEPEDKLTLMPGQPPAVPFSAVCWGHPFTSGDSADGALTKAVAESLKHILLDCRVAERQLQACQPMAAVEAAERCLHRLSENLLPEGSGQERQPVQSVALGKHHVHRMRALDALLQAALAAQCWEAASTAAAALTPMYELVYAPVWPNLGLHYALVAKLAAFLQNDDAVLRAAESAFGVLRHTHPDTITLREVLRLRAEALAAKQGRMEA